MFFLFKEIIAVGNTHAKKVTVFEAVTVFPLLSVTFTDKVKLFAEFITPKSILPAEVIVLVTPFIVASYLLILALFLAVALVIVANRFDRFCTSF